MEERDVAGEMDLLSSDVIASNDAQDSRKEGFNWVELCDGIVLVL